MFNFSGGKKNSDINKINSPFHAQGNRDGFLAD